MVVCNTIPEPVNGYNNTLQDPGQSTVKPQQLSTPASRAAEPDDFPDEAWEAALLDPPVH